MKKHILLQCIALAAALLLSGCAKAPKTPEDPTEFVAESAQMLKISLKKDEESAQLFSAEELGGNFNRGLLYRRVKDVAIGIHGEKIPLESALEQGHITEETIWYYCQQDARNGFSQESWGSRLGLSWVTFDYADYTVVMAKDVYETPNGQQHLISSMIIHDPKGGMYAEPIYGSYYDEETFLRIDREDWGLTWEVLEATPESAVIQITQSGGQQIGTLTIAWLNIYGDTGDTIARAAAFDPILLKMNGTTEFTVDLSAVHGPLSSGSYRLAFEITDDFNPEDVHPLMKDYYQTQLYELEISIP